jgi:hypothetical protein
MKDLQSVLGYKYPAAQQLFPMFSKTTNMILQEMSVPAGLSEAQIIQRWADNLVVTRVIYHADYGGFNISDKTYQWFMHNAVSENFEIAKWDLQMSLCYMPRHHPKLIEAYDALDEDFGTNMNCAVILGTTYRIQDYDGFEQVRVPAMDSWIDSTARFKDFNKYMWQPSEMPKE